MKYLPGLLLCLFFLSLAGDAAAQNKVGDKLETLVLPALHFKETPLSDAIEFLHRKTIELDPEKKGVNIAILNPDLQKNPVTLMLRDIPIGDAIRYTSMLGGGHMKKGEFAITIVPEEQAEKGKAIVFDSSIYEKKLQSIVIPSIEFHDTPLRDALEFLVAKSREIDPDRKGINIVYHGTQNRIPVTLRLNDIPLGQALQYAVEIAGHQQSVESNAVVISTR